MTSFYSAEELESLGFKECGKNVLISRKCSIYGASNISIGDNVRIDDFCILSGNIKIGSNIHISAYAALYGAKGIVLEDFTGISPRATIYSAMDDFSGNFLIGPIHPESKTNVTGGPVIIKKYAHICANSIVYPNITVPEGTVIGAMSLVNKPLKEWTIYIGTPVVPLKERDKSVINLEY